MIMNAGQFLINDTMRPRFICTYGESAWLLPHPRDTHTHKRTIEEDLWLTRLKTKSEVIGLHATDVQKQKQQQQNPPPHPTPFTHSLQAGTAGEPSRDGHVDFYTAPELWTVRVSSSFSMVLYVSTETIRLIRYGSPGRPPVDFHTASERRLWTVRASSFFMALYSFNFNSGLSTDVLCVLFFSVVVVAVFLFPF